MAAVVQNIGTLSNFSIGILSCATAPQWFQTAKTCQKYVNLMWFHEIFFKQVSVSGHSMSFIFLICQTVAGISMTSQFHELFNIIFGGFSVVSTIDPIFMIFGTTFFWTVIAGVKSHWLVQTNDRSDEISYSSKPFCWKWWSVTEFSTTVGICKKNFIDIYIYIFFL